MTGGNRARVRPKPSSVWFWDTSGPSGRGIGGFYHRRREGSGVRFLRVVSRAASGAGSSARNFSDFDVRFSDEKDLSGKIRAEKSSSRSSNTQVTPNGHQ